MHKYRHINENVNITSDEADALVDIIDNELSDLDGFIDLDDEHADYGYINVGIECNNIQLSYDIEAVHDDELLVSVDVINSNKLTKTVGIYDTLDEAALGIARHCRKFVR